MNRILHTPDFDTAFASEVSLSTCVSESEARRRVVQIDEAMKKINHHADRAAREGVVKGHKATKVYPRTIYRIDLSRAHMFHHLQPRI